MRLSTLARKIDKTPNQLISILEKKEIAITNGLHTKLESETVNIILQEFLPEQQIIDPVETNIEVESIHVDKSNDDESSQTKNVLDTVQKMKQLK